MTFSLMKTDLHALDELECETLVTHHFVEDRPLQGLAGFVDWRMNGWLSQQIVKGIASGRVRETILTPGGRHLGVKRVLLVGLGTRNEFSPDHFRGVCLSTLRTLIRIPSRRFAVDLPGLSSFNVAPRQAMEMWLTAYHQTVVSLGLQGVHVTFLGEEEELEDWRDPLSVFEKQYSEA